MDENIFAKLYDRLLDKLLDNTDDLNSVEKTTIISIYTMVVIYGSIHVLFLCFFYINNIPELVFVNASSVLICLFNLYVLTDIKRLTLGLILWICNSCYYIIATTYLLGYNKNAIIFLPILLLLIHFIFPKEKKYLLVNTLIVLFTYCAHVYIKYTVTAIYFDRFNFIDAINNFCALVLSILIIYLKSTTDNLIEKHNSKQLKGLAEEVDVLTTEACEDFLTGLWNRRYIEKQLLVEDLSDAYIIIADIDYFKRINDVYGHLCGDFILKEFSNFLKTKFRNVDLVCRWGGEEFLIFLKSPDINNVTEKLEKIRNTVEETEYEFSEYKINFTVTFGFYKIDTTIPIEKNIDYADAALYYGKANGRNCVVNYDDILNDND